MSKVDAQRALRDARYARFAERASEVVTRPTPSADTPVKKKAAPDPGLVELFAVEPATAPPKPKPEPGEPKVQPPPEAELPSLIPAGPVVEGEEEPDVASEPCGHRSINGRSCTRDKAHPQKNHRYN